MFVYDGKTVQFYMQAQDPIHNTKYVFAGQRAQYHTKFETQSKFIMMIDLLKNSLCLPPLIFVPIQTITIKIYRNE
jgi:hypothetical protein